MWISGKQRKLSHCDEECRRLTEGVGAVRVVRGGDAHVAAVLGQRHRQLVMVAALAVHLLFHEVHSIQRRGVPERR